MEYILADTRRLANSSFIRIDYRAATLDRALTHHKNRAHITSDAAARFNTELDQSLARAGFTRYAGRFTSPTISPVWSTAQKNVFTQYDPLRTQHVDEVIAELTHRHLHASGISPQVLGRHDDAMFQIKPQTIRTLNDAVRESSLLATIYEDHGETRLGVRAPPGVAEHVQRRLGTPLRQEPWEALEGWMNYCVWSQPQGLPQPVYGRIVSALTEVARDTTQRSEVLVLRPGERPEVLASRVA